MILVRNGKKKGRSERSKTAVPVTRCSDDYAKTRQTISADMVYGRKGEKAATSIVDPNPDHEV